MQTRLMFSWYLRCTFTFFIKRGAQHFIFLLLKVTKWRKCILVFVSQTLFDDSCQLTDFFCPPTSTKCPAEASKWTLTDSLVTAVCKHITYCNTNVITVLTKYVCGKLVIWKDNFWETGLFTKQNSPIISSGDPSYGTKLGEKKLLVYNICWVYQKQQQFF